MPPPPRCARPPAGVVEPTGPAGGGGEGGGLLGARHGERMVGEGGLRRMQQGGCAAETHWPMARLCKDVCAALGPSAATHLGVVVVVAPWWTDVLQDRGGRLPMTHAVPVPPTILPPPPGWPAGVCGPGLHGAARHRPSRRADGRGALLPARPCARRCLPGAGDWRGCGGGGRVAGRRGELQGAVRTGQLPATKARAALDRNACAIIRHDLWFHRTCVRAAAGPA